MQLQHSARVAAGALVALTACGPLVSPASAAQIRIDGVSWPTNAEFATGPDETVFTNDDKSNNPPQTLSQTFQVDEAFDARSLFFSYRNREPDSITARLQIFEVADRFAAMLPDDGAIAPSDVVFDAVIEGPSTDGGRVVAQVLFDSPVPLLPTTGAAGYAVRVTNLDAGPGEQSQFRWYRKGGGNDAEGELYTGGNGYREGTPRGFQRDYAVALSSVPEPSTVALLAAAGVTALARRRVQGG